VCGALMGHCVVDCGVVRGDERGVGAKAVTVQLANRTARAEVNVLIFWCIVME
jgi:hypothetical protein